MSPHELYTSLVAKSKVMNYNYIALGKTLKELKDNETWRDAVGGVDTWQSFVKQPEVGLSVGEASKLIDIYETYVVGLEIDEEMLSRVSMKNLKIMLPIAKDIEHYSGDFTDLMFKAENLSDRDFKEALIETSDTLEKVPRTYRYQIMKVCNETGTMRKVHGISSAYLDTIQTLDEANMNKND